MELVHETLMSYSQSLDPRTTFIDPAKIPASFQARLHLILSLALIAHVTCPCYKTARVIAKRHANRPPASEIRLATNSLSEYLAELHPANPPSYSVSPDKVKLRLFEPFSIRRRLRYLGNRRKVERSIISLGN